MHKNLILLYICLSIVIPSVALIAQNDRVRFEPEPDHVQHCKLLNEQAKNLLQSDPENARKIATNCVMFAHEHQIKGELCEATRILGTSYFYQARYDSALYYFKRARQLGSALSDQILRATIELSISACYIRQQHYEQALKTLQAVIEVDDLPTRRNIFHNLGYIYHTLGQNEEAIAWFQKSLHISTVRADSAQIAATLNLIGEVYRATDEPDSAYAYYMRAHEIAVAMNNLREQVAILNNLGTIYLHEGEYAKARTWFLKSKAISEQLDNTLAICILDYNLGLSYRLQEIPLKAIKYQQNALKLAREHQYEDRIVLGLEEMHLLYHDMGRYAKAYQYQQEWYQLKDSLSQINQMQDIKQLQDSISQKTQQMETAYLNQEIRIQQALLYSAGFGLLVLVILLLVQGGRYHIRRRTQIELNRQNQRIQEQNKIIQQKNQRMEQAMQEMRNWAYMTSHDLKAPLRRIGSYITLLQRKSGENLNEDGHECIREVVDNVHHMQGLLGDIMTYASLENQPQAPVKVDLNQLLLKLERHFKNTSGIPFQIKYEPLPTIISHYSWMQSLFYQLIDNAIKFQSSQELEIEISAKKMDSAYKISFRDNSIGMAPDQHQKVFSMFYQINPRETEKGRGIGLAICKKIVCLHHGKIKIESNMGAGSCFHIIISDLETEEMLQ